MENKAKWGNTFNHSANVVTNRLLKTAFLGRCPSYFLTILILNFTFTFHVLYFTIKVEAVVVSIVVIIVALLCLRSIILLKRPNVYRFSSVIFTVVVVIVVSSAVIVVTIVFIVVVIVVGKLPFLPRLSSFLFCSD